MRQPESGQAAERVVLRQAAAIWLGTRVVYAIFTYFAVLFMAQPTGGRLNLKPFPPHILLDAWNRWDANWYLQIATHGYAILPGNDIHRLGFFPLFPFLTHLVSLVIGQDHVVGAGMIVSNLATLVGFCALALLALDLFGARTAPFAVRMAAAYPLAFFATAPYSDSLLFALAALSLLFARRGMWEWAAACAFLAGFDRLLAIVLIPPLVWEYVRQNYHRGMRPHDLLSPRLMGRGVLVALAVPAALVLWSAYLGMRFGHPFGYLDAQNRYWGHESFAPWDGIRLAYQSVMNASPWAYARARVLVDVAPVAAFALITLASIRRIPVTFTLYMAALMAVLLSSGVPMDYNPLNGEGRYLIIAIPVFLILGKWTARRPALDTALIAGGFMLQGLLTAFFLHDGWLV
jgi:hypothetical protein